MPSLLPGFEYDIFISYRHNDNRSGWVTEFVEALQEELSATIKEPLSIYFDKNPHDGLLETHNVDKSLEGKLKCLIFIPIVSQTYCDPKSFAWQYEFVAFNKLSQEDELGRDIKLSNGNVASRILPIKIHELDLEDKATIENEIGGVLRAIEFSYKESGVNRPLKSTDDRSLNLERTDYQNQINKVANAIKDIISALKPSGKHFASTFEHKIVHPTKRTRKLGALVSVVVIILAVAGYFLYSKILLQDNSGIPDKSIAVLPFADMSPNQDQSYLGDGIAEEIINVLTKIEGVSVIGRTSSFSFRNRNEDLVSIGTQLGVATILEGSVRKSNNMLRITAQLIDTKTGNHIWSETYEREFTDVFSIQDDISSKIADKFKLTITSQSETGLTHNSEAYEWYLKGKELKNIGITKVEEAKKCIERAILLDSTFVAAYAELSTININMAIYSRGDIKELGLRAKNAAKKAIQFAPDSYHGYRELAWINFVFDRDWAEVYKNYGIAVEKEMPVPDHSFAYYEANIYGRGDKAVTIIQELLKKDPLSMELLLDLSRMFLYAGRFKEAVDNSKIILKLSPNNSSAQRHIGEAYTFSGNPELALPYFSELMKKDSTYSPDGYVGALVGLKREDEAKKIFLSISKPIAASKKAMAYIHLNELDSTFKYLDKAIADGESYISFLKAEPTFQLIKDDPRYVALLNKLNFR